MRILILSVVFLTSAAASVPIRDGCTEDSAVVADVQDSDPIQVRHGVLGETLPCYAVSVTQAGKELRGFILGSSLPKPKSAQSIAGRPVDTDDDGLADIIKRARPALERARELYGHYLTWRIDGTQADRGTPASGGTSDDNPDIFTAIRDLGLRLEPAKSAVDVIVIDHIERPDEN